jgi:uncharacterized protein HemX
MAPGTDENGGDPRGTLAPAARSAASGRKDALRAGTVVPVAIGLMLGIAYLGYANVQRQIKAQHAELQSLKDKVQGMGGAQSRTDADRSQPSISEIQGLQNHVDNLPGRAKKQKK